MWGNLWVMDFHNRPFMIVPSPKSASGAFLLPLSFFLIGKRFTIYFLHPGSPFHSEGTASHLFFSPVSHLFFGNRILIGYTLEHFY
jgi:hypothetical protein